MCENDKIMKMYVQTLSKKTELMAFNFNNAVDLQTLAGQNVKKVENFKYLVVDDELREGL